MSTKKEQRCIPSTIWLGEHTNKGVRTRVGQNIFYEEEDRTTEALVMCLRACGLRRCFRDGVTAHRPSISRWNQPSSCRPSSTLQRGHASPHDLVHQQNVAGNDRTVGERKELPLRINHIISAKGQASFPFKIHEWNLIKNVTALNWIIYLRPPFWLQANVKSSQLDYCRRIHLKTKHEFFLTMNEGAVSWHCSYPKPLPQQEP